MKLKLLLIVLIVNYLSGFSQELTTNSYGSVLNKEKNILKPAEVKQLLTNYPEQLAQYAAGHQKRTLGNVFIYTGIGLIFTDLAIGLGKDLSFPKALSAVGFGAIAIGVPIKLGYSKKIKNAIDDYNTNKKIGYNPNLHLIGTSTGLALKLSFN